uniref:Uncharacterized protein n=1 Tax=Astyanax mexicanus TaxID=7994 RepID=A0A8B9K5I1_ASTMX
MEELTEVITAAECHPHQCNVFVYSSSKGTIRLCDMRAAALCDRHSKFFEEPEDPSSRSFFSEIISSISDVKFSHSGVGPQHGEPACRDLPGTAHQTHSKTLPCTHSPHR